MNHHPKTQMTKPQLTAEQMAAVYCEGPQILVEACPGSGKTTMMIERIDRLREHQDRMLIQTFTQAAARQLRERLEARGIRPWHVGTDHSLCLRLARQENPALVLMDEQMVEDTLKEILTSLRSKVPMSRIREALRTGSETADTRPITFAFRKRQLQAGAIDFDGLIVRGQQLTHLLPKDAILMVDEYQDTSPAQDVFYDRIPAAQRFFIGNADQSIYGFRGASVLNLLMRAGHPETQVLGLTGNWRSGPTIVRVANQLIQHNLERVANVQPMTSAAALPDETAVQACLNEELELDVMAREIRQRPGTWAILCRYNATRLRIQKLLYSRGIPIPPEPEPRPRDLRRLALWLQLIATPENELLQRQIARIDHGQRAQLMIEAGQKLVTVPEAPQDWPGWMRATSQAKFSRGAVAALWEAHQRAGSLAPMDLSLALFDEPAPALPPNCVHLMTYHAAKGLEWDNVWLPALEHEAKHDGEDVEEERRLVFVGATRARHFLGLTWAGERQNPYSNRLEKRKPSRFVLELLGPEAQRFIR